MTDQTLTVIPPEQPLPLQTTDTAPVESHGITPAQAKVDAIAALTLSAYQQASKLNLTDEEIQKLSAEFPDEAFKTGAGGKEHLIYIEHAFLRDRLNQVFRPGQWAIVPRNRWAENFRTAKGVDGVRLYVEAMLCIRGCFAAEAVGEMEYYPSNASQSYGDAVEGAKTAALRRCCKELGIGLEAWKKDWCEGWWQRKRSGQAKGAPQHTPPVAHTPVKQSAPAPKPEPTENHYPTDKTRAFAIERLHAGTASPGRPLVHEFLIKAGCILPNEAVEDWPLEYVPGSMVELNMLATAIAAFEQGEEAKLPYPIHPVPVTPKKTPAATISPQKPTEKPIEVPRDANCDPNSPDAPWRAFPVPWGKHAGTKLGELDANVLFGFWANFTVETEYNGKPKSATKIAQDQQFRTMLDSCGQHYEFRRKEDQ